MIGTNEYLIGKINTLKDYIKPFYTKYDTDNLMRLKKLCSESDRQYVYPLISEISSYIHLYNFVNSAPTDIQEGDTDKEKITNAFRSEVRGLQEAIKGKDVHELFSWSNNDSINREEVKENTKYSIDEGLYEIAILNLVYLLHTTKLKIKTKEENGNDNGKTQQG